jgi:hypothetical protein
MQICAHKLPPFTMQATNRLQFYAFGVDRFTAAIRKTMFCFLKGFFCGVPLHTTQGTISLDSLLDMNMVTSPEAER